MCGPLAGIFSALVKGIEYLPISTLAVPLHPIYMSFVDPYLSKSQQDTANALNFVFISDCSSWTCRRQLDKNNLRCMRHLGMN